MNIAKKRADKTNHEEIAQLAYELWNKAGREQGRDLQHWLDAEKQCQSHSQGETKRQSTAQRIFNR